MAITRRNTLILLLTVVAAAGVIGGTGAFSTVNADRSVSVTTAGDANANVQFDVDPDDKFTSLSSDSDDTISMDFSDINLNANTTYNTALNVTVNTATGGSQYDIEIMNTPNDIDAEFSDGGKVLTDVGTGDAKSVDITVDTSTLDNTGDTVDDGEITFEVRRS